MASVSEYPAHIAGLGIGLLRGAVVLLLMTIAACVSHMVPAAAIALGVTALMIGIGLSTRLFAVVSAALCLSAAIGCGTSMALAVAATLAAGALALLGPGAYSVDAWLFGRHVIVSR